MPDEDSMPSTRGGSTSAVGDFITIHAVPTIAWENGFRRPSIASVRGTGRGPDAFAVHQELERIFEARSFAVSPRLVTLLRFLCGEALRPDGIDLKEVTIGNVLYRRDPPYDPRIDCTVRVEVRRLRKKLEAYYAGEGAKNPLRVYLPLGRYVPTFAFAEAPLESAGE